MNEKKILDYITLHYRNGEEEKNKICLVCHTHEDYVQIETTGLKKSQLLNIAKALESCIQDITQEV